MVHNNIGNLLYDMGHPAEALESYRRALAIFERLWREHPAVTQYQSVLARSHNNIGGLLSDTGHPAEAMKSHRRALAIRERLAHDNPTSRRIPARSGCQPLQYRQAAGPDAPSGRGVEVVPPGAGDSRTAGTYYPSATLCQSELAACHTNIGDLLRHRDTRPRRWTRTGGPWRSGNDWPATIRRFTPIKVISASRYRHRRDRDGPGTMAASSGAAGAGDQTSAGRPGCDAPPAVLSSRLSSAICSVSRKCTRRSNQPAEAIRTMQEFDDGGRRRIRPISTMSPAPWRLSVPLTPGEQQQALAVEAVQTLKQAIAAGWNDAQHTSRDPDLARSAIATTSAGCWPSCSTAAFRPIRLQSEEPRGQAADRLVGREPLPASESAGSDHQIKKRPSSNGDPRARSR